MVDAAGPPVLSSPILYWWPDEGWQLGRVRRPSRNPPVGGYRLATAAFAGEVASLVEAASHGSRWVSLVPAAARALPEQRYRESLSRPDQPGRPGCGRLYLSGYGRPLSDGFSKPFASLQRVSCVLMQCQPNGTS